MILNDFIRLVDRLREMGRIEKTFRSNIFRLGVGVVFVNVMFKNKFYLWNRIINSIN